MMIKCFLNKLKSEFEVYVRNIRLQWKWSATYLRRRCWKESKILMRFLFFFIDIDMPEVNGFEAASYLKKWNRECCSVCIE